MRRGSSSYAAGFSGIRRAPLASAATHASSPLQRGSATTAHDAAATAGLTVLTSSCSVADAAAAPSFDSARRHEAADRAQTATTALLLRSVSQWVRRVYQPELRRKPIGRCRHLLLLYASYTYANRVLMLRAARARCTG